MGRSIPTDEAAVLYPSLIADTSMRLQQLVNGWLQEIPDARTVHGSSSDLPEHKATPTLHKSPLIPGKTVIAAIERWSYPLRTIHLLEEFVPVPPQVRGAYPPRAVGKGDRDA